MSLASRKSCHDTSHEGNLIEPILTSRPRPCAPFCAPSSREVEQTNGLICSTACISEKCQAPIMRVGACDRPQGVQPCGVRVGLGFTPGLGGLPGDSQQDTAHVAGLPGLPAGGVDQFHGGAAVAARIRCSGPPGGFLTSLPALSPPHQWHCMPSIDSVEKIRQP